MGITEQTGASSSAFRKTYTLREAVEYMKNKNKTATRTGEKLTWVEVKTGKEVIIGYTG